MSVPVRVCPAAHLPAFCNSYFRAKIIRRSSSVHLGKRSSSVTPRTLRRLSTGLPR